MLFSNKIIIIDKDKMIKIKRKKLIKIDMVDRKIIDKKYKNKIILSDDCNDKKNNIITIHLLKNKININSPQGILIFNDDKKQVYLYKLGIIIEKYTYLDKEKFLMEKKNEFEKLINNNRIIDITGEYDYYSIIKEANKIYKNPYLNI